MVYVFIQKSGRFVVDISGLNCFDYRVIKRILDRYPNSVIEKVATNRFRIYFPIR